MRTFFPDGAAGAGLLLLRLAVVSSVLAWTSRTHLTPAAEGFALALCVGIMFGIRTRAIAAASTVLGVWMIVMDSPPLGSSLMHFMTSGALALTGPGSLSGDAILFGKKVVRLRGRADTDG